MPDNTLHLLYKIALTRINGVGDITARNLLSEFGSAEAVFCSGRKALTNIRGISSKMVDNILDSQVICDAESELNFIEKNKLKTYFITDDDYPHRLLECADAPILLYSKGRADLNASKIISIVGTRKSSNYGNLFCENFLKEIAEQFPDILIVSGLAYGIDIQAHRQALKNDLPTVGVLAHGLDRIYPSAHRQTAVEMVENGGLLTEFPSGTEPDRFNFVRRNRIVAGMADAVIVVESDIKGGSLITAEIANSYCKDVFAVPGRCNDAKSAGCNKLIASHKADLLYSTDYFIQQMGWGTDTKKQGENRIKQRDLFIELTNEEEQIVNKLNDMGVMHIDHLSREIGIPAYLLFSILLELEMKGVISNMPGNMFGVI